MDIILHVPLIATGRKTRATLTLVVVLTAAVVCRAAPLEIAPNAFEAAEAPTADGQIDRIVFADLARLNMRPVLCSDAVFVRRVYLDVIGTLPTAAEVREFIHNPDTTHKRRDLIDRLLERDEFADYWAMKWGDILRIKAEFPVNLWPNAAQAYYRWVHASIAANKPYDQFARELLTSSGSNFRIGPVNFYRAIQNRTPQGTAAAVALTFMGARTDSWPADRLTGMAAFFSQIGYKPTKEWKEEHVFWDPLHAAELTAKIAVAKDATAKATAAKEAAAKDAEAKAAAAKAAAGKAAAAKDAAAKNAATRDATAKDAAAKEALGKEAAAKAAAAKDAADKAVAARDAAGKDAAAKDAAAKTAVAKDAADKAVAAKDAAAKDAATKDAAAKDATAKAVTAKNTAAKDAAAYEAAAKEAADKETAAKVPPPKIEPPPPIPAWPPPKSEPLTAIFPDGTTIQVDPNRDPRELFADWLITPENPWFTRSIANRVWSWLLGRGVIHEPDDIREDNPPSNPALLAYLEKELVDNHYDLKRLYRLILNSKTYQLSSVPRLNTPQGEAHFAHYPLRRLDAEVLIDAINKITGATDLYTSPIPEPFTYIPEDKPAIAIADGSIISPFLALFGRSARATGMENERNNKPVPAQWLHLLNSSHIQGKLEQGPKLKAIIDSGRTQTEIVEELYLTILSRFPTPDEMKNAEAFGQNQTKPPASKDGKPVVSKRREDWVDLTWSLINSSEFLFRH